MMYIGTLPPMTLRELIRTLRIIEKMANVRFVTVNKGTGYLHFI